MKRFLLLLSFCCCLSVNAQIVNIPNPAFKAKLLMPNIASDATQQFIPTIDANGDGEIQVSEAQAVYSLRLTNLNLPNLDGIGAFSNLVWLTCNGSVTTINVSMLSHLYALEVKDNPALTSLNVSGLQQLYRLNVMYVQALPSLDISGLPSLEEVTLLQTTNMANLNITGTTNLSSLSITWNNKITNLDLSNKPNLEYLRCANSLMTSIDLSGVPILKSLYCNDNNFTAPIDVSQLTYLEYFDVTDNNVPAVIFGSNPFLKTINVTNNNISSINFGNLPSLIYFMGSQNNITSLDFSNCPYLSTVIAKNNNLEYLNVKNGNAGEMIDLAFNGNVYICVDEGEEALALAAMQGTTQTVSSYCSFTPGGNYNTIRGMFTFDGDNNGCSITDDLCGNIKLVIDDAFQTGATFSSQSGSYRFFTQAGNFTLSPQFENNWFTTTPAIATVNFADNNNNTTTQNFCITPNGIHPDVEVILVPENGAQPGFDARYKIVYRNKGNQTMTGNVVLNYDDSVLDYEALGSTAPTSISTGQLTWANTNLLPFESRTINVALNLNGPMETPPVNLDDVLNYSVSITPTAGDETPYDNTFTLNQIVTGSYDPNDITCLEGDTVHPDKIGDYLHYNINFENTGTAPATFIVVKDVINAAQYDINSLQMLHASHNVETRINGNKVEFFFDDINLGPSGKGNVVFKIKTKPTVAVNSTVMNKAEIFFDYNWPIVTNEAETTFSVLSAGDFALDNSVSIYPNPAITNVAIKTSSVITSVQLYDVQGRLLMATKDSTLDVSDRASGIYFLKVITEKGMKVEKLVRK